MYADTQRVKRGFHFDFYLRHDELSGGSDNRLKLLLLSI